MTEPNGQGSAPMPQIPPASNPAGEQTAAPPAAGQPAPTPQDFEKQRLAAEAKDWRKKFEAEHAEHEKLRTAHSSETEQAIAKARADGESVYLDKWKSTAMINAAQARLAEKGVKSIGLAAGVLNLADVGFDPLTGVVDTAALDQRIDAVLAQYPELVADGKVPPAQITGQQQRVTADTLVNASPADKNALLRYALGR